MRLTDDELRDVLERAAVAAFMGASAVLGGLVGSLITAQLMP